MAQRLGTLAIPPEDPGIQLPTTPTQQCNSSSTGCNAVSLVLKDIRHTHMWYRHIYCQTPIHTISFLNVL